MFTTYQYDPAGQLLTLTNALPNGTLLSYFNYTYDSRGRRTSADSLDGHWSYNYDDLGQLTHAILGSAAADIPDQDLHYVYDALGNRMQMVENGVTNVYTANSLNQYVTVGATNYTYDADGNLINEESASGITIYAYNDENRLVSMTSPGGSWQYTYDALENRTLVSANGTITRDVVDPIGLGNVVAEYDSSGNLLAHYDHALQGNGLLSRNDAGSGESFFTFDAVGHMQQTISPLGSVISSYSYGPFANLLDQTGPSSGPFRFSGQFGVQTDASGLQFMRARYYNAGLGRFCEPDPIGISGGVNLYSYTGNNPVYDVDPSGLMTFGQRWLKCTSEFPGNRWLSGTAPGRVLTSIVGAPGAIRTVSLGRLLGGAGHGNAYLAGEVPMDS
jgi:RHS repeat-associated protein